jgi:O-antigen ligase
MKYLFLNIKQFKYIFLGLFLWLMLWAGYNTGIYRVFTPGFPAGTMDLFHGVRAFSPIIAGILAVVFLAVKRNFTKKYFCGAMGFLSLYCAVGIISSTLSKNLITALYWALTYGAVLLVLWFVTAREESLKDFSYIINANWIIAGLIAVGLLVFFLIQPGAIQSLNWGNIFFGDARPYEGLSDVTAEVSTLGMAGTRPTGFGRYAGIVAIISLAGIFYSRKKQKYFWLVSLVLSTLILFFAKGRTEIVGFLFGGVILSWFSGRKKISFVFFIALLIFLFNLFGFGNVILNSQKRTIDKPVVGVGEDISNPAQVDVGLNKSVITLSGRTSGVWKDDWNLFLSSPLIGYGFQADRIFLQGQHAHNAILQALVQTGLVGTIFFILAVIYTWVVLMRLLQNKKIIGKERNILMQLFGVLLFFTVRGITESSGAFFSADWLFLAPVIAYIQFLYVNEPNKTL